MKTFILNKRNKDTKPSKSFCLSFCLHDIRLEHDKNKTVIYFACKEVSQGQIFFILIL